MSEVEELPAHSSSDNDVPGLWIGVIQEELNTAVATPILIQPCVITVGFFVRAKTKGLQMEKAPCCGTNIIRTPHKIEKDEHKKLQSVFVPLAINRLPAKRPYSRFSSDPISAILYLPSLLFSLLKQDNMTVVSRSILSASVDISLHVPQLLSRLQSFGSNEKPLPLFLTTETFPILLHVPISIILLLLLNSDCIQSNVIDSCLSKLNEEYVRRVQLTSLFNKYHRVSLSDSDKDMKILSQAVYIVKNLQQKGSSRMMIDVEEKRIKRIKPDDGNHQTTAIVEQRNPTADDALLMFKKCVEEMFCDKSDSQDYVEKHITTETERFHELLLKCLPENVISVLRNRHQMSVLTSDLRLLQPKEGSIVQHPLSLCDKYRLPPGLIYIEDFITEEHEQMLINNVQQDLGEGHPGMLRKVAHFGFKYRYPASGIDVDNPISSPVWMVELSKKVEEHIKCKNGLLSQLTVNEYQPGQGIAPHFDCFDTIGEPLCTVSLGCDAAMSFNNPDTQMTVEILLRRRSIAILTGDSRYVWTHAIPKRKTDAFQKKGKPISRGTRLSLTLRNVPPVKDWKVSE